MATILETHRESLVRAINERGVRGLTEAEKHWAERYGLIVRHGAHRTRRKVYREDLAGRAVGFEEERPAER